MSEIRFACPLCSQHLACDDIYCRERINCPSCKAELLVPGQAAFAMPSGAPVMASPVSPKQPPPIPTAGTASLSGSNLGQRDSRSVSAGTWRMLPFWVLLFLPFLLAVVIPKQRNGLRTIESLFVFCAIAAGFYLAAVQKKTDVGIALKGILYTLAMLLVFVVVGVGVLFVGCLVILSMH